MEPDFDNRSDLPFAGARAMDLDTVGLEMGLHQVSYAVNPFGVERGGIGHDVAGSVFNWRLA